MQIKQLGRLVDAIGGRSNEQNLLVIGDIMLDQYVEARSEGRRDGAGFPIAIAGVNVHCAGGAANVAINCAMLGARVSLAGMVGKDDSGDRVLEILGSKGVDTSLITRLAEWKTPKKVRLSINDNRCWRIDTESKQQVTTAQERLLLDVLGEESRSFNTIVISDYNKGTLSSAIVEWLHKSFALKTPLIVAVKPRVDGISGKSYFRMPGVQLMTLNLEEACSLCGVEISSVSLRGCGEICEREDIRFLVRRLMDTYSPGNLMITLADIGCVITGEKIETCHLPIPIPATDVFEVTGAGDTLVATYATALSALGPGSNPIEIATLAMLAATLVVQKRHTAGVTIGDLRRAVGGPNCSTDAGV